MENQTFEATENLIGNTRITNLSIGKIPGAISYSPGSDNPGGVYPPSPTNFPSSISAVNGNYTFQVSLYLQNTVKNPLTTYSIYASLDAVNSNLYFCYNALSATQDLNTLYSLVQVTIIIPQASLSTNASLNLYLTNTNTAKSELQGEDGGGDTPSGTTSRGTKTVAVGR